MVPPMDQPRYTPVKVTPFWTEVTTPQGLGNCSRLSPMPAHFRKPTLILKQPSNPTSFVPSIVHRQHDGPVRSPRTYGNVLSRRSVRIVPSP